MILFYNVNIIKLWFIKEEMVILNAKMHGMWSFLCVFLICVPFLSEGVYL